MKIEISVPSRTGTQKGYGRRKKARRPSKWTALVIYFLEKMPREELGQEQV
jgi:hypothetical protein